MDSESADESRTNAMRGGHIQFRGTMASRLSRRTWSCSKT